MNTAIREMEAEIHEIILHVKEAAERGDITWAQRDELLRLVYQDVNDKLILARDMLYAWTGIKVSGGDLPRAE